MPPWAARQFGKIFDEFKRDCPPQAWDDLLINYALLRQLGPLCGPRVAKKLKIGKGIWELLGHADNHQPRVLFYVSGRTIVFVHAFMKKGNQDYKNAIALAQSRRALIESGKKATYELNPQPTVH